MRETYRVTVVTVTAFLEGAFGTDTDEVGRVLAREAAGGRVAWRHRPSLESPPEPYALLDSLRADVGRGVDRYRAMKVRDSTYQPFAEIDMVELAYELFNQLDRPEDAIAVGRLAIEEYPESYTAHGYLADLYRKHQDWANALASFSAAHWLAAQSRHAGGVERENQMRYYQRRIDELRTRLTR